MPAEVTTDFALEWTARLNLKEAEKDAQKLAEIFNSVGFKLFDSAEIQKQFGEINKNAKKNVETITDSAKEAADKIQEINKLQILDARKTQEQITDIEETEIQKRVRLYTGPQYVAGQAKTQYSQGAPVKNDSVISDDYLKRLDQATKKYDDLSITEQNYVEELTLLRLEETKLTALEKERDALRKKGLITEEQYVNSTIQLSAAQKQVADSIIAVKEGQKQIEIATTKQIGETDALIKKINDLTASYNAMSRARQNSSEGKTLKTDIGSLRSTVDTTKTNVTQITEITEKSGKGISKFFSGVYSQLKTVAYLIPGLGIAGLLGGIVDIVVDLFKEIVTGANGAITATKLLADTLETQTRKMAEARAGMEPYVNALKEVNLTENEKLNIYNKLIEIDPQIVKGIDAKSLSYENLKNNVSAYLDKLRENILIEANKEGFTKSVQNEIELTGKAVRLLEKQKDLLSTISRLEKAGPGSDETAAFLRKDLQSLVSDINSTSKAIEDQKKVSESFGIAIIKNENLIVAAKTRTIDVIDADIAAQQKLQSATSTNSAEYNRIQKNIDALEKEKEAITGKTKAQIAGENQYQNMLKKRQDLLDKISNLERDARQTGYTKQASELDNINQKYDQQITAVRKLNDAIDAYNAKTKGSKVNNIGEDIISRINVARDLEIRNFNIKQDVDKYTEGIKNKQDAFEKFNNIVLEGDQIVIEKAKQTYGQDVVNYKNYLSLLYAERNKYLSKLLTGQGSSADALKLSNLNSLIKTAEPEQQERDKQQAIKDLQDLLKASETFEQARNKIITKYAKLNKALQDKSNGLSEGDRKEAADILQKQKEDELEAAQEILLKQDKIYQNYYADKENASAKTALAVIAHLKKEQDAVEKTSAAYIAYQNAILGVMKTAGLSDDKGSKQKFVDGVRQATAALSDVFAQVNIKLTKDVVITGQQIEKIFTNIATLLDGKSTNGAKQASIIGLIVSAVTSISNVATSALKTKKDVATGLEGSAEVAKSTVLAIDAQNAALERQRAIVDSLYGENKINGLLDLQDQLQKKQEETFAALKKLQVDSIVSQGEFYVDSLFHGTDKAFKADSTTGKIFGILNDPLGLIPKTVRVKLETIDTSSFTTFEDFVNLLDDIKANGGTFKGKLVTDDDLKSLESLVNNYTDLVEKQKELKAELQQIFTGTTTNAIADQIVDGFRQGKKSAEDFADNFHDLMKEAVLNALKFQTLEEPLQNFYDQFALKSASDNVLTADEIAQLQQTYDDIIDKAAAQFENLKSITQLDFSAGANEANSLKGAISGITEQQADLLAGQFGGLRLTAIDQLRTAQAGIQILAKIESNTYQLIPILAMFNKWDKSGLKVN